MALSPLRRLRRTSTTPAIAASHASLDDSAPPPTAEIAQPPLLPVSADGAAHFPLESQIVGATQSLTEVHACWHAPLLSHLYGVQSCFVPSAPVTV